MDTNFLVYAEGLDDVRRRDVAKQLLRGLDSVDLLIPVQVLAELHNVMLRRGIAADAAAVLVMSWADLYATIDTSYQVLKQSIDLRLRHRLPVFDALILAAAALADCTMLLSEDFQHGFGWQGCTVINPFLEPMNPLLASAIVPQIEP